MAASADRDLLYGLIALQNQFIDQGDLIAAFHSWSEDRSRPLARILRDRGAVDDDAAMLLDALLIRHLARHGDPARGLEALSALGSTAEALLTRVPDPDLHASLGHVARAHAVASFPTLAPDPGDPGPSSVRFRRLRPHARGNLGEVFIAHDRELHREVALKEIQEKHADEPSSRGRFLVEAEITGGLEHPGIVPVYGLGTYADGRPFYAMRFIRGDNLADSIRAFHAGAGANSGERAVDLRKLLRRFLDVCNAMAYAHSRGVLHRDLKPGNIMVGKYGETLVVDWGLAKSLGAGGAAEGGEGSLIPPSGSGMAATVAGTVVGTPAYMSPEQARGEHDRLGPASDVYGLGATLYHLLTGRAPFEGRDLGELLRKVEAGDYPSPRSVAADIPKGLEAICRKAMARAPEDRYPTPLALAADLEHWLADEPTSALPEGAGARLARWARRHRAATLSAAAALLAISLAATTAFLVVVRALATEKRAVTQMHDVFEKARGTIDDYLTILRDDRQLRETPELGPFRERMLRRALTYSQDFIAKYEADPLLRADVADAYSRAGNLNNEIGSKAESIRAYQNALTIREAQLKDGPVDHRFSENLARMLNHLAFALRDVGRAEEADANFSRAIEIYERLASAHPAVAEYQEGLAYNLMNRGLLHSDHGRTGEEERSYARAIEIFERLDAAHPAVEAYQEGLALTSMNLAVLQRHTGRPADAERSLARAIETYERLVSAHPDVAEYQTGMGSSYINLGLQQSDAGRPADAERSDARAIEIYERLASAHPEVTAYQDRLASISNNHGVLLSDLGRQADAERCYARAREIQERLVAAHPEVAAYKEALASTLTDMGLMQRRGGRTAEAERSYTRAREIRDRLVAEQPGVVDYRHNLAKTHYNLGNLQGDDDRSPEAERSYARALEIYEQLAAEHPDMPEFQNAIADIHGNAQILLSRSGRVPEAVRRLGLALEIYERLVAAHPGVVEYRAGLGKTCANLALRQAGAKQLPEAERNLARAREVYERLTAENPGDATCQDNLATTMTNLGMLQSQTGRVSEAERSHQRSREVRERLVAEYPDDSEFRCGLGATLNNLGAVFLNTGRPAEARPLFREAIDHQRRALAAEPRNPTFRLFLRHHAKNLADAEVKLKHPAEAADAALIWRDLYPSNPIELYNVACTLALCVPLAPEGDPRRDRYAALSVETLRRAVRSGWIDFNHTATDPDLAPLRGRPDFRALLTETMDRALPADPFAK